MVATENNQISTCQQGAPALHIFYNNITTQVGCFNHRVVALVADKLERQWLLEVCFGVED